jgi:hypothetical protein
MTREQFLNGTTFTVGVPRYKGAETFKYDGSCVIRESRSSQTNEVLFTCHECNILEIGRVVFTGFTFIVGKRVNIKYRFEDLVEFKEEA